MITDDNLEFVANSEEEAKVKDFHARNPILNRRTSLFFEISLNKKKKVTLNISKCCKMTIVIS